jgi:hypothetical protein
LFETDSPSVSDEGDGDGGVPEDVPRRRKMLLLQPRDRTEEKEGAIEDNGSREKFDVEKDNAVVM